jgi:hypothetical protein
MSREQRQEAIAVITPLVAGVREAYGKARDAEWGYEWAIKRLERALGGQRPPADLMFRRGTYPQIAEGLLMDLGLIDEEAA